jgi:uncharacterized protein DUF6894
MPRYRFDLTNGNRFCADDQEGVRLRDLDAARQYAIEDIRDLMRQKPEGDWTGWRVEITDLRGQKLLEVLFSEAAGDGAGREKQAPGSETAA